MAVDSELLLASMGVIIVSAFFGYLGFRYFRVPDIIFLIGLGVLLGPLIRFVDVDLFEAIMPFVGTLAIVIILFEGGLRIRKDELLTGVATGSLMALAVFSATALLAALVGVVMAGLPMPLAVLLGMCLGGAGVVIVIPLIQQMRVQRGAQTIVSIEAAVSDVLVVIGVVGLSTALVLRQTVPLEFAKLLVQTFIIGIGLGLAAGLGWAYVLRAFRQRSYEYVLTLAVLFLLYSATETLDGSGAIAVLAFGLVVGNSAKARGLAREVEYGGAVAAARWSAIPVFGRELLTMHHEVVFFVRAFFFVSLGIILDTSLFADWRFLGVGAMLALAVVAARYWGTTLLVGRSKTLTDWDKTSIALMFPLGLAAAVVSTIPSQRFGLEGTNRFPDYAVVAIVLTNLVSATLVFIMSHRHERKKAAAPVGLPAGPGPEQPPTEPPQPANDTGSEDADPKEPADKP